MRILVDTNILFSAILFPLSTPAKALEHAIEHHKIVLCVQNIVELREIVNRKIPKRLADIDELLRKMSFEEISVESYDDVKIRDVTDQPILNAAIKKNIDIIITGDKDFLSMNMEQPKCMTAAQFLDSEGIKK